MVYIKVYLDNSAFDEASKIKKNQVSLTKGPQKKRFEPERKTLCKTRRKRKQNTKV